LTNLYLTVEDLIGQRTRSRSFLEYSTFDMPDQP